MPEGLTIEWSGTHRRQRIRFEARDAGGWRRIEEARSRDGHWRTIGSEIVTELVVEDTADVADTIPL